MSIEEELGKVYTAQEVADYLKTDIMFIYRAIGAGKIQAMKIGKEYRISQHRLIEFLENSRVKNKGAKQND